MATLRALSEIHVPSPQPDITYRARVLDREFTFQGLKRLLGAADIAKAGERIAGLAATDEVEREAARAALSQLTLQHLYVHPLTDDYGRVDDVMRVNYDIDPTAFAAIAPMTLAEFKNHLLRTPASALFSIHGALTGVMAAAVAKLMDVHELILVAKKFKPHAKARTLVGLPGTLSSRLQPNHPTDNLNGMTLLAYTGLSMGTGDILIGVNPATDTVDNVSAILKQIDAIRTQTGAPTQICVLAHVKTQLACLERGAPVEIMFQSIAGTERALTEEFDVTIELLDRAYQTMAERGPLRDVAENWMYFETGQGSELTYSKHNGMDMATCEALCYGLARRYRPFMLNNVTGFIGPETHVDNFEMIYANLQDHFMGKLLGIPMGMAPCYTLHSQINIEGHQIATQLLTAAGANFFMDVYLTTDRMLSYFDTSGHDDQTLREVHNLRPAPEYLRWALGRGIFAQDTEGNVSRGPHWGKPSIFCNSETEYQQLVDTVPAAYGFENAGPRPTNQVARTLRANLAVAREAIYAELRLETFGDTPIREVRTIAGNRHEHLSNPQLGSRLANDSAASLSPEHTDIQIVASDGLSADALHHNVPILLPVLLDGLQAHRLKLGRVMVARFGRVKLAEAIGDALQTRLVIMLIGERPGGDALASRSMSAYFAYRLPEGEPHSEAARLSGNANIRYEYSVISNIYSGGLPPFEAGSVIVEKAIEILQHQAAGNRLEQLLRATTH